MNKEEVIQKYEGKALRDNEFQETFMFDGARDWQVVGTFPQRFQIIDENEVITKPESKKPVQEDRL